jgi:hypothetical protein
MVAIAAGDCVGAAEVLTCEAQWEAMMDPLEGQAKAIIAAALIVRGAVEVPAIPTGTQRVPDAGGMRLRELTDYVYRLLTADQPPEPE